PTGPVSPTGAPPASAQTVTSGGPATRARTPTAIHRPPADRASQPGPPHQHGGPSNFTGVWPSSPPNPAAPRTGRPSSTIPAPKPVPGASTTSEQAPRPAPNIHSPSACALTSLSTNTGSPNRAASSAASARPPSSGT